MIDPSAAPDPPPGFPDPPRDRLEFWVRFVFGALFGIVFGGLLWLRYLYQVEFGWLAIPITGLVCAFAVRITGTICGCRYAIRNGYDGGEQSISVSYEPSSQGTEVGSLGY